MHLPLTQSEVYRYQKKAMLMDASFQKPVLSKNTRTLSIFLSYLCAKFKRRFTNVVLAITFGSENSFYIWMQKILSFLITAGVIFVIFVTKSFSIVVGISELRDHWWFVALACKMTSLYVAFRSLSLSLSVCLSLSLSLSLPWSLIFLTLVLNCPISAHIAASVQCCQISNLSIPNSCCYPFYLDIDSFRFTQATIGEIHWKSFWCDVTKHKSFLLYSYCVNVGV